MLMFYVIFMFLKSIVRPMLRGRGANVTNFDLANLFSHD